MDIVIHTYGRPHYADQHTLHQLQEDGIKPTIVIQSRERGLYPWVEEMGLSIHVLPDHIRKLAPTRDYLLHDPVWTDNKVVFLDDDLHFAVRRLDDPTKFRKIQPGDVKAMFEAIERGLDHYPHVGIGAREGGNRVTEEVVECTRIMRVLGYRRDVARKEGICFTPLEVMEDFHVNLQFLRAGHKTATMNTWVSNQAGGSDAPGGCSAYRTDAVQTESAHRLAARHPGFVRVVEKTTKGAWGGKTRTDVTVYWKKAYASSKGMF